MSRDRVIRVCVLCDQGELVPGICAKAPDGTHNPDQLGRCCARCDGTGAVDDPVTGAVRDRRCDACDGYGWVA